MDTIKEHPILFSTPMVQAVLDERKTQTRRIFKPMIPEGFAAPYQDGHGKYAQWIVSGRIIKCPYGHDGDMLWVRESFLPRLQGAAFIYRADLSDFEAAGVAALYSDRGWKPGIHMPRKAARILLNILSIRVERVQAISQEDAKAEGVIPMPHRPASEGCKAHADNSLSRDCYVCAFKVLWNQINGERANWDVNPLVWVIKFKP